MTEAEWLTSDEPDLMLEHLMGKVSRADLVSFVRQCWRRITPYLPPGPHEYTVVEQFEEVLDRPGEAIAAPDHQHFELSAAGVGQELIEAGAPRLRAGDLVGVLVDDLEAALSGERTEIMELGLRMLIDGRNPHIEGGAFH